MGFERVETKLGTVERLSDSVNQNMWLRDIFVLTKPTITLLVVITTIPGLLLSCTKVPQLWPTLAMLLGTAAVSASAAVFNQIFEYNIDQCMERTKNRSLPRQAVTIETAIFFGTILGISGLAILFVWTTPLAMICALAGHLFYVVVYTLLLKQRTPQNIVIGGAAGSVGPLIGWAAVSGTLSWTAWILFLIIFLWTPPHFWALSLKYKDDYERAGVPMYPVVYGEEKTRVAIFRYSLLLIPAVLTLLLSNRVGYSFFALAVPLTVKFVMDSWKLSQSKNNESAMNFFIYSCIYVFALFVSLSLDRLLCLLHVSDIA